MQVKFWGVRGSIASPGPDTMRYGGNTTCIEVRAGDELIILDGGTGIFPLSQTLFSEMPRKFRIFITHSHWDHIQGLPFFIPIFVPGNEIHVYGTADPLTHKGIEQVYNIQLQYSYFPIREEELSANLHYHNLQPGESVRLGDVTVTPTLMNHPVINFGYRIDHDGKSVFFTGDHEPLYNIHHTDDDEWPEYERMMQQKNAEMDEAMHGVDLLIADSSYTPGEYLQKKGWGHGTYDSSIAMAQRVGAKKLICTHHEPLRTDDMLEQVFEEALNRCKPSPELDVELAREGLVIEI